MDKITVSIGNQEYDVLVAKTDEERSTGLSKTTELDEDEGMIFIIPEEYQDEVQFTMEETSIPLDIIFIDEAGEVISVHSVEPYSKEPITEQDVAFVLEVNINSGIKPGDILEEVEDSDYSEEEKETISKSKMLIIDENGNVQGKIDEGCRIFSRIFTRKMIKQAIKAYKSDQDSDYIKLGRMVFKELNAQDSRSPEYVEAPKPQKTEK